MTVDLDLAISIEDSDKLCELQGVEYLYNDALERGKLEAIIRKLPRSDSIIDILQKEVISYNDLPSGWEDQLTVEVNSLIQLLPKGSLNEVGSFSYRDAVKDTDEEYVLNGELNKWFRKASGGILTSNERALGPFSLPSFQISPRTYLHYPRKQSARLG
ncbi:hypothetical protein SLH49_21260 [Cognatiyoonia sp. IB215446]|uniref:hypothetical protein n=1 Tax=Cognatiyoonia sp. IB215446 TaxID=3097355 RepID=UPI002A0FCE11|nr:hypothetical protein [Cognatiyoonia sp. IB215446]MDX8350527.1 hypothetical protein [Cognatiyoonia sp. IB215446]